MTADRVKTLVKDLKYSIKTDYTILDMHDYHAILQALASYYSVPLDELQEI